MNEKVLHYYNALVRKKGIFNYIMLYDIEISAVVVETSNVDG